VLLIADNLQLTHGPLARAIAHCDVHPLQECTRHLASAGAEAIDLNFGPLTQNTAEKAAFCLQAVRHVTDLPLLLDSVDPRVIHAGLISGDGRRMIINGFSLEPYKIKQILPLAVEFGVEIVGYLIDARSQVPGGLEARLSTALELCELAQGAGLPAERLIVDPVIVPVNWQDALQRNRDTLEIIRRLPEMLGHPVQTIAALSNLTSGASLRAAKEQVESAYLPMLAEAGLSMLLLNWTHPASVAAARISRRLLGHGIFSWAELDCFQGHPKSERDTPGGA
jgi:5-methyltetrahydrofolate corrinoid/iron sulfur protein methyltransferase